jgi:transposase InsO family protein
MLVTVAEAAQRLNITARTVQRWIKLSKVPVEGWRSTRGGRTALVDLGKCDKVRQSPHQSPQGKDQSFPQDIWLSASQISPLLGIKEHSVYERAKREGWGVKKNGTENSSLLPSHLDECDGITPSERTTRLRADGETGGPSEYKKGCLTYPLSSLPSEARHRYLEEHKARILRTAAPHSPGIEALTDVPPAQAEAAVRRLRFVREAQSIQKIMPSEWKRRGISRRTALEKLAKKSGVTYPTLLGWVHSYNREGIAGLVPRPHGHQAGTLDEAAQGMAFTLYADRQQPSYQQAYEAFALWCKKQDRPAVSYDVFYRFLKSVPPATIDYWRKGSAYIRKNYVPPILRLLDDLAVNECWMGDATTLDVFCLYPKRPNPVRPTLTAWMDIRSRLVVGFMIAPTVNTNTVALGFRDAVLRYGLPEVIYVDNGREYRNKNWRGQVVSYGHLEAAHIKGRWERLGILPMFAWPYNPQSKGQIERWFNTLSHSFLNLLPGYSGANITARTKRKDQERLSLEIKQGALLSFDELTVAVGEAIKAYNHKAHKALGGKSPAQIFEEGYGQPRLVSERALDFCLAKQRVVTIKSGGITARETGVTYISYDPAYIRAIGRKGMLAYDPRDVSQAHLSAIVNKREVYCCAVAPREGIAFRASEAELKEAIGRKKRTHKLIAEAARAMKHKEIDVRGKLREANFAVDPQEQESFERGIAIKRGEGNVVQLVDAPTRLDGRVGISSPLRTTHLDEGDERYAEEQGKEALVGLFD